MYEIAAQNATDAIDTDKVVLDIDEALAEKVYRYIVPVNADEDV